jgi:VanZ family protein
VLEIAFWVPLAACTYLALVPRLPDLPPFALSDVILHAVAFSYLTFALMLARYRGPDRVGAVSVRVFVMMAGYGLLIELLQAFVPERTPSVKDLVVDVVGIAAGLAVARSAVRPLSELALRLAGRT